VLNRLLCRVRLRPTHESDGKERASTYTQARLPEASDAAILEYCAAYTTVVSAIEGDIRMMCPTACSHHSRVLDFDQGLLEPEKLVPLRMEEPSERRQLNVVLLESAIGKDERHGGVSLCLPGRFEA
jgi:hypothetical protein